MDKKLQKKKTNSDLSLSLSLSLKNNEMMETIWIYKALKKTMLNANK